ncbi:MAG: LamG-like jellyroll fold domain-containing protein, partial [Candidatus Neomarinimicrobiota bacterium]
GHGLTPDPVDSLSVKDGSYWEGTEEAAETPGFDFEFHIKIPDGYIPTELNITAGYDGNPAHEVQLQVYDYTNTKWDTLSNYADIGSKTVADSIYYLTDDHTTADDTVKLRFVHNSTGAASQYMWVDYIGLDSHNGGSPGHWIFSNYYDSQEGGSGYIGQNWSGGTPSLGSDVVTNGSFTVDASGWSIGGGGSGTNELVTGNGFSGNAFRLNCATANYATWQNVGQSSSFIYKYSFKYRCSGNLYFYWENVSGTAKTLSANTGDAITYTMYGENPAQGFIAFYVKDNDEWVEIDDIVVQKIDCDNALMFYGWVDYDDVESDLSGAAHPSYENGDTLGFDGATTHWTFVPVNIGRTHTIEWWHKFPNQLNEGTQTIIGGDDNTEYIGVDADDGSFGYRNGVDYIFSDNTTAGTTDWTYCAIVRDGATLIYYVNGDSVDTQTLPGNNDFIMEDIGQAGGFRWHEGTINEIRVTRSALSAQDIKASYGLAKGWAQIDNNATWKNVNFSQRLGRDATGLGRIALSMSTNANNLYRADFDINAASGDRLDIHLNTTLIHRITSTTMQTNSSYLFYFRPALSSWNLRFYAYDLDEYVDVDNIVIREVTNVSKVANNFVEDFSQYDNHGVTVSALEDEQPTQPYSWEYDGVADFVNFGDLDYIDIDTPFIIFAWGYYTSGMANNTIISKQKGTTGYIGWGVFLNINEYLLLSYVHTISPSNYIEKKANHAPNEGWNLFSISHDGSGDVSGIKIYYDDSEVSGYGSTVNTLTDSILNDINLQISGRDGANILWENNIGLSGIYVFDGLAGRPSSLPSNYEIAIIQEIYKNTSKYYSDD